MFVAAHAIARHAVHVFEYEWPMLFNVAGDARPLTVIGNQAKGIHASVRIVTGGTFHPSCPSFVCIGFGKGHACVFVTGQAQIFLF